MSPAAMVVNDLWEEFRITEERQISFKEVLTRLRMPKRQSFWALKGIDLEVARGETLGLIGPNGSGKSTLLKCLAGILRPTRGSVLVAGTVSSLIELGAGFHHELTGRENAQLTAAFFGFGRSEFRERLGDVIEFAELEDFIDRPVRSYSSGMIVRLAFSLAVHVEADILLIDEVLAVGDESFQRKCVRRIEELSKKGITMVFVSHDLPLVEQVTSRCVWMDHGLVKADGHSREVIKAYLAQASANDSDKSRSDSLS